MPDAASTTIRARSPLRNQHFNPIKHEISLEVPASALNHDDATTSGPFGSYAIRNLITKTLFAACLCTAPNLHAEGDAYKTSPKFTAAMTEARDSARKRHFTFAIDAYKKACKIADNQDAQCLKQLLRPSNKKRSRTKTQPSPPPVEIAIATTPKEKVSRRDQPGRALYDPGTRKK